MKYIISLDGRESEPIDITQVVALHQSGALKRNSRVREDRADAEWATPERTFPFLVTVRTWSEIVEKMASSGNQGVSCTLSKVDIGFMNLVALLFKISLAAIPAALLLWLVFGAIGLLVAGLFGGLVHMVH